jgi:hypothetical protein
MSFSIIMPIDYTVLPAAMLAEVKAHCRVRHTDDDALLKSYTGQAISFAQYVWGLQVFGADVTWTPEPAGTAARYQMPVWPASSFVVMSDAVDVSAEYQIEATSLDQPWWLARIDGTNFPDDAVVTLTTGFTDPATMEPAMSSIILRITAGLYEYREPYGTDGFLPSWANDMLVGLWVPRA